MDKEFFYEGGDTGCLLLHGLGSSPSEMFPLAKYLASKGYSVFAPLIPGHGTTPSDLRKTKWYDWYKGLDNSFKVLNKNCKDIFVMGLSMGGALTLLSAIKKELPIKGIVTLAAPIYLGDQIAYLSPVLKYILPYKKNKHDTKSYRGYPRYTYDKMPLNSVHNIIILVEKIKKELSQIEIPIFVAHSKDDKVVDFKSASYIYENVGSKNKKLFVLEKSGHIITMGPENELLFKEIEKFLRGV